MEVVSLALGFAARGLDGLAASATASSAGRAAASPGRKGVMVLVIVDQRTRSS
jgi:hypothetical protein